MTDVWCAPLGTALGKEMVSAIELVEKHGPVRDGFLERTGFTTLRRAGNGVSGLDLAVDALKGVDVAGLSLDALIYVTSTPDLVAPGNAHLLQSRLGLPPQLLLLDLNDACTGFIRALHVANSLISSGTARHVLVVLSDTYTKLFDESELRVSPLFSDGASAFVVSADQIGDLPSRHWHIEASWFFSDGDHSQDLAISHDHNFDLGSLEMNGGAVLNFVLSHLSDCVNAITQTTGGPQGVGRWYVHQGSRAVVSGVEKFLGATPGTLFRSSEYGNVVGSSLPFMIAEDQSEMRKPESIGLLAFGVGLTMAGMLVEQLGE